jgi:hypothetical protein
MTGQDSIEVERVYANPPWARASLCLGRAGKE